MKADRLEPSEEQSIRAIISALIQENRQRDGYEQGARWRSDERGPVPAQFRSGNQR